MSSASLPLSAPAARTGDIYIMNAETGAQFHLTVELASAPPAASSSSSSRSSRAYTKVTGRALRHTVERALMPRARSSRSHAHRYSVLPSSHGKPRRELTDDMLLRHGAVVEVTPCGCGCREGGKASVPPPFTQEATNPSLSRSPRTAAAAEEPKARGGANLDRALSGTVPDRSVSLKERPQTTSQRPAPAPSSLSPAASSTAPDAARLPREEKREEPASRDAYYMETRASRSPSRDALERRPRTEGTPTVSTPPTSQPQTLHPVSSRDSSVSFATVSLSSAAAEVPAPQKRPPQPSRTTTSADGRGRSGDDGTGRQPVRTAAFECDERQAGSGGDRPSPLMRQQQQQQQQQRRAGPPSPPPAATHAAEKKSVALTSEAERPPIRSHAGPRGKNADGGKERSTSSSSSAPQPSVDAPHPFKRVEQLLRGGPALNREGHAPPARAALSLSGSHAAATEASAPSASASASELSSTLHHPSALNRTQEPLPAPPESLESEEDTPPSVPAWRRDAESSNRGKSNSTATSATVADVLSLEPPRTPTEDLFASHPARAMAAGVSATPPNERAGNGRAARAEDPPVVAQISQEETGEESERVRKLRARLAEREALLATEAAAAEAKLAAMHAYMDKEKAKVTERYDKRARELQKEIEKRDKARARAEAASTRERRLRFADKQDAAETAAQMQDLLVELNDVHDEIFSLWSAALTERQRREEPPLTAFAWQSSHQKGKALTHKLCESVAYKHVYKAQHQALQLCELQRQKELEELQLLEKNLAYAAEEAKGDVRVVVRLRPTKDAVLRLHRLRAKERGGGAAGAGSSSWRATVEELLDAVMATPSPYSVNVNERRGTITLRDAVKGPRQHTLANVYGPLLDTAALTKADNDERDAGEHRGAEDDAEEEDQARIFDEQLAPILVDMCQRGRNAAVLGYGATGSGKTYTLLGASLAHGLYNRTGGQKKEDGEEKELRGGDRESDDGGFDGDDDDDDDDDGTLYQWCLSSSTASMSPVSEDLLSVHNGAAPSPTEAEKVADGRSSPLSRSQSGAADALRGDREGISAVKAPVPRHGQARAMRLSPHASPTGADRDGRLRATMALQGVGLKRGDGLLPRALAWLACHASDGGRGKRVIFSRRAPEAPAVLSFTLSIFEVYNDRVYDLLADPIPSTQDFNIPYKRAGAEDARERDGGVSFTVLGGKGGGSRAAQPLPSASSEGHAAAELRGGRQEIGQLPTFADGKRWDDGNMGKDAFRENPHRLVELVPFHAGVRRGSGGAGGVVDTGCWTVAAEEVAFFAEEGSRRQLFQRAMRCVQHAVQRRRTAATARNTTSSRSHLFVRVKVTAVSAGKKSGFAPRETELIFCDLAGSERPSDNGPGAALHRRREAQYINKSLCAVGDVMAEMASRPIPRTVVDAAKAALHASQQRQADTAVGATTGDAGHSVEDSPSASGGVSPTRMRALQDTPALANDVPGLPLPKSLREATARTASSILVEPTSPPPTAAMDPLRVWSALVPRRGITLSARVGRPVVITVPGSPAMPAATGGGSGTVRATTGSPAEGSKSLPAASAALPLEGGARAPAAATAGQCEKKKAEARTAEGAACGNVRTSTVRSVTRKSDLLAAAAASPSAAAHPAHASSRAVGASLRHNKVTMLLQPALNVGGGGAAPRATLLCVACLSPCSLGEVLPHCVFGLEYERAADTADPADRGDDVASIKAKNRTSFPSATSQYGPAAGEKRAEDGKTTVVATAAASKGVGVTKAGRPLKPPTASSMLKRMNARFEKVGPLLMSEANSTLAFAAQGAAGQRVKLDGA